MLQWVADNGLLTKAGGHYTDFGRRQSPGWYTSPAFFSFPLNPRPTDQPITMLQVSELTCERDRRLLFEALNFSLEPGQLSHQQA